MSDIEQYIAKEDLVATPDAVFDSSGQMILPNENGPRLFIRGGDEDIDIDAILKDAMKSGVILEEQRSRFIGRPAAIVAGIGFLGILGSEAIHESLLGAFSAAITAPALVRSLFR